jgi:hypothetical protein
MTYPGFESGTFGLAVSIANHYTILGRPFLSHKAKEVCIHGASLYSSSFGTVLQEE